MKHDLIVLSKIVNIYEKLQNKFIEEIGKIVNRYEKYQNKLIEEIG